MNLNDVDIRLSGMPGDTVHFQNETGQATGIIKAAGWQAAPKGGRIWTYELTSGEFVPNLLVTMIYKNRQNGVDTINSLAELLKTIDRSDLPSTIKTVINCLVKNDLKSLEVASFLLNQRIEELNKLINSQSWDNNKETANG